MSIGEMLMDTVLPTLRMHEVYAHELSADVDDADLDKTPGPGHENTPRFTIGHLCYGTALTRWDFEHPDEDDVPQLDIPPVYVELFKRLGPEDRRMPQRSPDAPSQSELIAELNRQHTLLDAVVRASPDELLERCVEWKLGHLLGRYVDVVMFDCSHEMLHLGQLAAWRRAMGLDAAMAHMIRGPNVGLVPESTAD